MLHSKTSCLPGSPEGELSSSITSFVIVETYFSWSFSCVTLRFPPLSSGQLEEQQEKAIDRYRYNIIDHGHKKTYSYVFFCSWVLHPKVLFQPTIRDCICRSPSDHMHKRLRSHEPSLSSQSNWISLA